MSTKNKRKNTKRELERQSLKGHIQLRFLVPKKRVVKNKRITKQVRLSQKSHKALKKIAFRERKTLSKMLDEIVRYYKRNSSL